MAPNTFTAIIVDDLPYAIEILSAKLKYLFSSINVIGKFTSWENALEGLNNLDPDIVFMDISMPGKSGMDILRMVPTLQAEIIFITAHKDYARSAFDFAASGYILKPIDDLELTIAVEKAMERTKHKRLAKQHVDLFLLYDRCSWWCCFCYWQSFICFFNHSGCSCSNWLWFFKFCKGSC